MNEKLQSQNPETPPITSIGEALAQLAMLDSLYELNYQTEHVYSSQPQPTDEAFYPPHKSLILGALPTDQINRTPITKIEKDTIAAIVAQLRSQNQ